jgi:hypothetical protein
LPSLSQLQFANRLPLSGHRGQGPTCGWLEPVAIEAHRDIRLLVGVLMMPAVHRDAARRRFLQARHRRYYHGVLQPFRTFQAAMGQQAVIAKVDAEQPA